jgi:tRNA(Arg) A34 adenosine deaminase TadA
MSSSTHEHYMRRAVEVARGNRKAPFGALLVHRTSGKIVAEGLNRGHEGPIWHGEMDVIHRCATAGPPVAWSELRLYTTAEPCCMCQGAVVWAGIPEVVYGTSITTLRQLGWKQIDIRAAEVARRTPFASCTLIGGILASECDALFEAVNRRT